MRKTSRTLSRAVTDCTSAILDLEDELKVEQPEHFENGDDVVPTGKPAAGKLGKRPAAEGAEVSDDLFPETQDPDSGDAVAHVSVPDAIDKACRGVINRSDGVRRMLSKKSIAEDVNETMNDLTGALHELSEVSDALSDREKRLSSGGQ